MPAALFWLHHLNGRLLLLRNVPLLLLPIVLADAAAIPGTVGASASRPEVLNSYLVT